MEECELCGKQTPAIYVVSVEDVEFRVCTSCARGKKIISEPEDLKQPRKLQYVKERKPENDAGPELIDNYGSAIKKARDAMKMPLKALAELINEKETFLSRVEEQKTEPPIALVKKLEKALNITLTTTEKPETKTHSIGQRGPASIGDYAVK